LLKITIGIEIPSAALPLRMPPLASAKPAEAEANRATETAAEANARAQTVARQRWPIWAPLAAVILLAALWSGLWYVSASVADRALSGWIEREAAAGRAYSCGSETIGGFPFNITARCADVAAEITNSQPHYAVGAKALDFVAEIYRPTRLVGEVTGPLTVAVTGQPPSLTADWSRARLVVSGVPPQPDTLSIALDEAHLDRASDSSPLFAARRAELHGRIRPDARDPSARFGACGRWHSSGAFRSIALTAAGRESAAPPTTAAARCGCSAGAAGSLRSAAGPTGASSCRGSSRSACR